MISRKEALQQPSKYSEHMGRITEISGFRRMSYRTLFDDGRRREDIATIFWLVD